MGPAGCGLGEKHSDNTKQRLDRVALSQYRGQESHRAGSPSAKPTSGLGHSLGCSHPEHCGVLSHISRPADLMPGVPPVMTTTNVSDMAQCPLETESPLDETLR